MKVLYDVQVTGCRYTNQADFQMEAQLLGLAPDSSPIDVLRELQRFKLDEYHRGCVVKKASA